MTAAAFLACCNGAYGSYYGGGSSGGGTTYTLSGQVTLTSLSATGNATITASMGGYNYSGMGTLSGTTTQTATYSVTGLPYGTYSVSVAITSPNASLSVHTYQVNGGTIYPGSTAYTGYGPYTWTETFTLVVGANDTVNWAMQ